MFLARPFTTTCQQSILSVGRSDIILKIEIAVNAIAIGILFFSVFVLKSVIGIAIGTLIADIISVGLFMYYENKIIHYSLKEQLQDLLPSLILASVMGGGVYIIHFLPITDWIKLLIQVIVGILFYIGISYLIQFEPFLYLIKMILEKTHNIKMNRMISKFVRRKKS